MPMKDRLGDIVKRLRKAKAEVRKLQKAYWAAYCADQNRMRKAVDRLPVKRYAVLGNPPKRRRSA